jgi:DNA-binding NtrC family response regulator
MPTTSPRVLVVDDEKIISDMLFEVLRKKNFQVSVANSGKVALDKIKSEAYDLIITDLYLQDANGMEILKSAKAVEPKTGVIMITGHGSVESAVEAMRVGAYDYLTKGSSLDEIELTVDKFFSYQKLVNENELLRSELGHHLGIADIIGRSPKMQKIFETVDMVAPSNATVLIQGPSGTGKELIARAIHSASNRRDEPFIKTNCAAIPEGLIESELFGHEKGAFTGAIKSTKGRFELADGGTLLLDEISEIRPNLQAKLLRVLQEKEFEKVGNPRPVQVDVRVIATTNRDLHEEIKRGNFREDLYYRLNVVRIMLPPLRERRDDIPLLVKHFVERFANENGRTISGVDESAMQRLISHDWPGNVRELENIIERAVVISRDPTIQVKHLFADADQNQSTSDNKPLVLPRDMTLRELVRHMILKTLKEEGGNRTWASKKLGISVRTLRNKLNEYRAEGFVIDDDPENGDRQ